MKITRNANMMMTDAQDVCGFVNRRVNMTVGLSMMHCRVPIMLPPSGFVGANGALVLGQRPDATVTPGATTGTNVIVTASANVFSSTDVGRRICDLGGGNYLTITAYTTPTSVVGNITGTLASSYTSGNWTLVTPLYTTYSAGCYMYFPAGALYTNSPAGFWYVVMSSQTNGTVYANRHLAGMPVPVSGSPTPISSVSVGAYTTPINIEFEAMRDVIPAFLVGINGMVACEIWTRQPHLNTNQKTHNIRFGSAYLGIMGASVTNSAFYSALYRLVCKGSLKRCIKTGWQSYGGSGSFDAIGNDITSLDFGVDTPVAITLKIANANDFLVLESFDTTVYPGD